MALQVYAFAEVALFWNWLLTLIMLQLTWLPLLQFQSDGSKQEDKEKMVSLFWRKVFLCKIVIETKCLITVQLYFLCRVLCLTNVHYRLVLIFIGKFEPVIGGVFCIPVFSFPFFFLFSCIPQTWSCSFSPVHYSSYLLRISWNTSGCLFYKYTFHGGTLYLTEFTGEKHREKEKLEAVEVFNSTMANFLYFLIYWIIKIWSQWSPSVLLRSNL